MNGGARAESEDAAYRAQIGYLLARSRFYRDKLGRAGIAAAADAGGLDRIGDLPFTEKDELRRSRSADDPIGTHLAVPVSELARIYSTSGTTGVPSYIPLTRSDLEGWIDISSRTYGTSGVRAGEVLVSTYGAGPFVAGVALDAFARLGLCHVPVGAGNSDRLIAAVRNLRPTVLAMTPSYALHAAERAAAQGVDTAASSVRRILVAGEPGGGEPAMRARIEAAWGARVTEAMGIGDIAVSLWGECSHQTGMHFSGGGRVHVELIEPETGRPLAMEAGAEGELVYTHLRQRAAPLLRFRSRDHVRVIAGTCPCGRPDPRIRCIGRSDDMLILRGVNVFPSAIRELVAEFTPAVSGMIVIRPAADGVRQSPPLPVTVELSEAESPDPALAAAIESRLRERLIVATKVTLAPWGALPRSDYKSKLVDWPSAQ